MNKANLIRIQALEHEIATISNDLATLTDLLASLEGSPAFRTINLYLRKYLTRAEEKAGSSLNQSEFARGECQGQITAFKTALQVHIELATSVDGAAAKIRDRQAMIQKLRQQP